MLMTLLLFSVTKILDISQFFSVLKLNISKCEIAGTGVLKVVQMVLCDV